MTTITATYERDEDGSWIVHLADEPRAHTYGRTIRRARANIIEVIELWYELTPGQYVLEEIFDLPDGLGDRLATTIAQRRNLVAAEESVAATTGQTVHAASKAGLSVRDIA